MHRLGVGFGFENIQRQFDYGPLKPKFLVEERVRFAKNDYVKTWVSFRLFVFFRTF